jgi:hypothetical protein
VSPEDTALAVGSRATQTLGRLDPRSINPWCAECGASINPLTLTDAIGFCMPDGSHRHVGLCRGCLHSLDEASHQETIRRLRAIRAKAFS